MTRTLSTLLTTVLAVAPAFANRPAESSDPGAFDQLIHWSAVDGLGTISLPEGSLTRIDGKWNPEPEPAQQKKKPCSAQLHLPEEFARMAQNEMIGRPAIEKLVVAACAGVGRCDQGQEFVTLRDRTLGEIGVAGGQADIISVMFHNTVKHYLEGHDHDHVAHHDSVLAYGALSPNITFGDFVTWLAS